MLADHRIRSEIEPRTVSPRGLRFSAPLNDRVDNRSLHGPIDRRPLAWSFDTGVYLDLLRGQP